MDDVNSNSGGTADKVVAGTNNNVSNITDAAEISKGKAAKSLAKGLPPKGSVKPPPKDKPEKTPLGILHKTVVNAFNQEASNILPDPGVRFGLYYDPQKKTRLFERLDGNLCVDVDPDYLARCIARYVHGKLSYLGEYAFTAPSSKACADLYSQVTDDVQQPKPWVYKSNKEDLTYSRLPFDLEFGKPCPDWDELGGRMTNKDAVWAFIGSLLEMKSSRQQYLWLFGDGNDGKGALLRFLYKTFGLAAQSQQQLPDVKGNKHWAEAYANKRLILFPDFDDIEGIKKGVFKSLTGDDPVYVDPKGTKGYTVSLICKSVLSSNNYMPDISSKHSDLRRLIHCGISRAPKDDHLYEERLWGQGGAFLAMCLETYRRLCPEHQRIPVSDSSAEAVANWASTLEEEFEVFFERHFEMAGAKDFLRPAIMQDLLAANWPQVRQPRLDFVAWLQRTKGVTKKNVRPSGHGYMGIRIRQRSLPLDNCVSPLECQDKAGCHGPKNCPNK